MLGYRRMRSLTRVLVLSQVIKEQIKAQMLSQLVDSMAVADPVQVSIISVLKLFLSQTDASLEPARHNRVHQVSCRVCIRATAVSALLLSAPACI